MAEIKATGATAWDFAIAVITSWYLVLGLILSAAFVFYFVHATSEPGAEVTLPGIKYTKSKTPLALCKFVNLSGKESEPKPDQAIQVQQKQLQDRIDRSIQALSRVFDDKNLIKMGFEGGVIGHQLKAQCEKEGCAP